MEIIQSLPINWHKFVNSFLESSQASIGNLIAEGNRTKILQLFWELLNMRYFVGGVFSFSIFILLEPFISIWLGHEYILLRLCYILSF